METFKLEIDDAVQTASATPQGYQPGKLLAVAFGGGTNSTAMLCGFRERGIKPDLITFADTGGELPRTYDHVMEMDTQCRTWWGVGIDTVKTTYKGQPETLEENCLRKMMLPSLAYGTKGCSNKFKVDPQNKRLFSFMNEMGAKEIIKCIGYDAGESHRRLDKTSMTHTKGRIEYFWYPLVEWGWRRAECVEAIKRHGLTQPGKSSCFFCPAMKRGEIIELRENYPAYFERAIRMEEMANAPDGINKEPRGLTGRSFMWRDIANEEDAQGKLWEYLDANDESPVPCGCYDG